MDLPRTDQGSRRIRRFSIALGGVGVLGLLAFGAARLEPGAPAVSRELIIIDSVRRGEMVRAVRGPGTLVAAPGGVAAVLRIPDSQAPGLSAGQAAIVDARGGTIRGRVARIAPEAEDGTVRVEVALEGPIPRGAVAGRSVEGTIALERLPSVLHTGRPAYAQSAGSARVWKVVEDGNAAVQVPVRIGRVSVSTVEIVSGLAPGDRVILSNLSRWDGFRRLVIRD